MVQALGLLGIDPQGASQTGHAVMLFVDSGVLIGLSRRWTWGYWLALGLLGQQTLFQTYWARGAAISHAPLWWAQLATPIVCLACLLVLVLRRDLFRLEDPDDENVQRSGKHP